MNNLAKLPDKIEVKIIKDNSGVFVAELPEFNLHTEADTIWALISNVNDIVKLYFDIPENNLNGFVYTPLMINKEPNIRQLNSMDFLKYISPSVHTCLQ